MTEQCLPTLRDIQAVARCHNECDKDKKPEPEPASETWEEWKKNLVRDLIHSLPQPLPEGAQNCLLSKQNFLAYFVRVTKMDAEEAQFFKLLDEYSRKQYGCFVSEMFISKANMEYVLCFRPATTGTTSSDRYACRYLRVRTEDVRNMGKSQTLTASMTDALKEKLPSLQSLEEGPDPS